jgi:hypothetical protein
MNNVPSYLALEFLQAFSHFEFALKRVDRFCKGKEGGDAMPNWDHFGGGAAALLEARLQSEGRLQNAVALLVDQPPKKEIVVNGVAVFQDDATLGGNSTGEKLLLAVRRVRNNLFHGGKHQSERYYGHDKALVEQSLVVLRAAKEIAGAVEPRLHQHLFD